MTFELQESSVVAFVLALVRAGAWLSLVPPFGSRGIPVQVRIGLSAALALPVTATLAEAGPPTDTVGLIGAVVLQIAVGLTLGFFTLLLFAAMQAAGDLIDTFSGLGLARIIDPITGVDTSVFGRFYQLLATTLLFAVEGHLLVVRGFLQSFEAVGVRGPAIHDFSAALAHDLGLFLLAAVEIAAPILGALFIAEVGLGLLAKTAPQMNVFLVGMPVKILLTLTLAGLALPLLPGGLSNLVDESVKATGGIARVFGGG